MAQPEDGSGSGRRKQRRNPRTRARRAQQAEKRHQRSEWTGDSADKDKVYAEFAGTCRHCGKPYSQGQWIAKIRDDWGHPNCAREAARRAQILGGATYRGQAAKTWRIGKGPASGGNRTY
jgi:hypothetical protein